MSIDVNRPPNTVLADGLRGAGRVGAVRTDVADPEIGLGRAGLVDEQHAASVVRAIGLVRDLGSDPAALRQSPKAVSSSAARPAVDVADDRDDQAITAALLRVVAPQVVERIDSRPRSPPSVGRPYGGRRTARRRRNQADQRARIASLAAAIDWTARASLVELGRVQRGRMSMSPRSPSMRSVSLTGSWRRARGPRGCAPALSCAPTPSTLAANVAASRLPGTLLQQLGEQCRRAFLAGCVGQRTAPHGHRERHERRIAFFDQQQLRAIAQRHALERWQRYAARSLGHGRGCAGRDQRHERQHARGLHGVCSVDPPRARVTRSPPAAIRANRRCGWCS